MHKIGQRDGTDSRNRPHALKTMRTFWDAASFDEAHARSEGQPAAGGQPGGARGAGNRHGSGGWRGQVYWNTERVAYEQLFDKLAQAARADPQPALHLRIDRDVRYQRVAEIMAAARNAGLTKLSFVTDPSSSATWTLPAESGLH